MSDFGENYRGAAGQGPLFAPSVTITLIAKNGALSAKVSKKMSLLQGDTAVYFIIQNEKVQTIMKITKFRKDYLNERKLC